MLQEQACCKSRRAAGAGVLQEQACSRSRRGLVVRVRWLLGEGERKLVR